MSKGDFEPAIRNSAWWASDSRKAVSGGLVDVILEKKGKKEPDDLSGVEVVQMGHVMQPVIGRLFAEQTGIEVQDLDVAGTHKRQEWLRAHTDFATGDGGLLETKNYNAAAINKYGEMDEEPRLPPADYIQCLHEATVFDVPHVYFAVLFGGQRFRWWKLEFNDSQKFQFIQRAATWWAYCNTEEMPSPETVEQARALYPVSIPRSITAGSQVVQAVESLRQIKAAIKELEIKEEAATTMLQAYMMDHEEIVDVAGTSLITWKQSKGSKRFDAKAFEAAMPDLYKQFMREQSGSRRFLVKG